MFRKPKPMDADPPQDPEILCWFQALGPPSSGRASPHLRAQVLARIEQQGAQRLVMAWVPYLSSPVWASGLVIGVLIAIGVWWGLSGLGWHRGPTVQAVKPLGVYQFQRQVQRPHALGSIVAARVPLEELTIGRGFTLPDARAMFFRLGTLYTDALATLQSGPPEGAMPHLRALTRGMERVPAPASLVAYLHEMQSLLQSQRYAGEVLATFLALFEVLYEVEYSGQKDTMAVTLFQAGAWVENLSLAAAAGDTASLRQEQALTTFHSALARLHVPSDVLQAFAHIRSIVARPALTDEAVGVVLMHLKTIQRHLGALDPQTRSQP